MLHIFLCTPPPPLPLPLPLPLFLHTQTVMTEITKSTFVLNDPVPPLGGRRNMYFQTPLVLPRRLLKVVFLHVMTLKRVSQF